MKTFEVSRGSLDKVAISGESLVQAAEDYFDKISSLTGLGNVAGMVFEKAWMIYEEGILGGKGGVALHIVAHGSDALIGYDATNDPAKEAVLWIDATREDLPARHDFEFREKAPFDPFDDAQVTTPTQAFGVALALIDEVGNYHSRITPDFNISNSLSVAYPTMQLVSPVRFMELARQRLSQAHPKDDKDTQRLLTRISELVVTFGESGKLEKNGADQLMYYRTLHYFNTYGRVSALAHYRDKCGKTQKQVADEVGISLRQVQYYENPASTRLGDAKYSVVERLAEAVGVTPDKLVKGGLPVLIRPNQRQESLDKE